MPASPAAPAPPPAAPPTAPAEERADAVVRRIVQADDVPAFSRVMRELMASLGRDESSTPQLATLVLRDYALTARVIRTANSAHYNRSGRPVQSATHAIMLLGARTVRELASGVLLFEQYRRRSPGLKELMLLSLLTAGHARAAAEALGGADPESAHLCGMFRNLGEVLVAAHLPDEYAAVLRGLAARRGAPRLAGARAAGGRAEAALAVLGCTFEDVGVAVARHWGMPDAVRHGMRAVGAPGEGRLEALAGFAHALTGAVYREDAARAGATTAELLDTQGRRLGVSRALCRRVADRAVDDTREVFAAAGMRLDDLRLARQVATALTEQSDAGRPVADAAADGPDAPGGAPGAPPGAGIAATPPAPRAALAGPAPAAAHPTLAEVRSRLAPELAAAAGDAEGYDLPRVLLMALEAVLRGGPFDRACFHTADSAGAFRPRTGLGEGAEALLADPGIPFAASSGPSGQALLRGDEVQLAHGTRLTIPELQLLRRWDAVSAVLVPVRVGDVVIGCVHADRRHTFAAPDTAAMAHLRDVVRSLERAMALRRAPASPAPATPAPATPAPASSPPPAVDLPAKMDAVLRLLRGEPPADVAGSLGIEVAVLDAWRADFLAGAAARLGG